MDNIDKMNRTKLKLSDLNPHLMCVLCGGYYIDATTIVECLHSFCRSCIVKHLESSKYCPICEVQVHKTKPLVNIRPDKTLQDIVYKLVPGLFANEMRNRRKFYRERPHYMKPNDSESVGEVSDESKVYIHDENITLSLDYHRSSKQGNLDNSFQEISKPVKSEKRYFKCPTGVTIYHLQKLLKAKYDLNDSNYKVEIYFKDQPLHEEFTLLDISYIYLWKSKGTLDLTFKIFENVVKRQKIEEIKEEPLSEVKKDLDVRLEPVNSCKEEVKMEPPSPIPVKPVEEPKSEPQEARPDPKSEPVPVKSETIKQNGVAGEESKEVQLQISESGVMSVSQIENGEVVRTVEESAPKMIDNYRNKSNTGIVPGKVPKPSDEVGKQERMNRLIPEQSKQPPKPVKPYKTIRCSPKSWNPVIPKEKLRPTLMKNSDEPKKPLKFFKMRNMPRFLGNPASGVKPMYAESSENDHAAERRAEERKNNTKALKNIIKIDPKTLRPIEKEEIPPIISTPSTPNLLTNPFIPNNNHFLFSDPLLLHPNLGKEKHNNNKTITTTTAAITITIIVATVITIIVAAVVIIAIIIAPGSRPGRRGLPYRTVRSRRSASRLPSTAPTSSRTSRISRSRTSTRRTTRSTP
ncbi:UNVERIFIED_CONTAM: hypothetical protein PYX00_004302 [Menopon gallinae]|uniref:RING-type domain-containing protein n=1 Tax=Menopon gallinae TaxID=328185 RepID=A0AAW2I4F6_9NEOP